MNLVDEGNEKDAIPDEEETYENEEFDKSSDLEEKKRATNKLNAEGNIANTQIFIQSLDKLNMNCILSSDEKNSKEPVRKYDLRNLDDCTEFVEKYGHSEYLATAIILSTFEVVTLGDLPDLQEKLIAYLPITEKLDNKENDCYQRNPYISLNTIFAIIGGERFVTEDGQTCVGLGKDSKQALINILEQFPLLRSSVVSWLIHINEIYRYRTTFDAYQVAVAFSRIISLDILDARKRVLSQLYTNPQNAGLLGTLAYILYEDIALKEDVENIIMQWMKSDSIWLWKSACLVYSLFMENDIEFSYEKILRQAIGKRILQFKGKDFDFISALMIRSKYFRGMMTDIFYGRYKAAKTIEYRTGLAQRYIHLIRHSYYLVNSSFVELPLVACDTKQQQENLRHILEEIMSVYRLRKQLYAILEAYMKELSNYNFSEKAINHISAYFYNMASVDTVYQQDVWFFLKRCQNKVAEQICDRLYSVYKRRDLLI
ncbi:MAG: hypothetical protein HDQ95_03945 [Roseburia sp.]|nr:hypothetical protein [Roseburia sp.]